MQKAKDVSKTRAELKKTRKDMLRKQFMPLSVDMEETFPTMKRVLRDGCGHSFNPYGTAYLKLMKWCQRRLPISKRKAAKCQRDHIKSYQQEKELLQKLEDMDKKYPKENVKSPEGVIGMTAMRYALKRQAELEKGMARLKDILDLNH